MLVPVRSKIIQISTDAYFIREKLLLFKIQHTKILDGEKITRFKILIFTHQISLNSILLFRVLYYLISH